jgi:MFS family permease
MMAMERSALNRTEPPSLPPVAIRQSLRDIRREAVPWAIMSGLTESYMIPYALALGASAFQAGLLSSVRNFILSLVQLKSAEAVSRFHSRKKLVWWTALVQGILWVPLAVVGPLFGQWAVPALIALYTVGTASAALGAPAWGSIVSEYLAPEERGCFFGRRIRVVGGWMTVTGLAAGILLQWSAATPLKGFGLLCAAAALSRMVSCYWLSRLKEGAWQEPAETQFSFWQFIRQVRTSNFARFSFCMGLFSFATHLAAPYMAVYMLQELRFGYFTYAVVVLTGSTAAFLSATRWGTVGDRCGNMLVARWTMLAVSILPLLWPLSQGPLWLLLMFLIGGSLWGGLDLAMVNFVYDASSPRKRTRCLAYFNVINGCGVSLGAMAGGWLIGWLPPIHSSSIVSVFYCSAVVRFVAAVVFIRAVREVRPVRQVGLREVVYDLVGQRVIHVLGFLSVIPEAEAKQPDPERAENP